jgi:hypothetical protein
VDQALELIKLAACYPWCKIVFSTRQEWLTLWSGKMAASEVSPLEDVRRYLYMPEGTLGRQQFPTLTVGAFTLAQAEEVYERYQAAAQVSGRPVPRDACLTPWRLLSAQTQALLTNPLHLHLFMKTFSGKPAGALASVPELYRTYVEETLRLHPGLEEAVAVVLDFLVRDPGRDSADLNDDDVHAITAAWQQGQSVLDWRFRLTPVEALAHEGFISKRLREEGGGYRFVFQKVAESGWKQTAAWRRRRR